MKKILCFVITLILIASLFVPASVAQTQADEDESVFKNAVNFTCTYQKKENRIYIDGTVAHDFLISHEDYKIAVYRILPSKTLEEVMADKDNVFTAQSDMTVKFTFYIDVEAILERFSKYAIVFVSPDGTQHPAGQPLIPSVPSDFEYNPYDKSGLKGICTDSSVEIGDSGAGTVIVDVDISKMRGDSVNSMLYPMGNTYVHYSKSYVSIIDKQFRAAKTNNARAYIRLLLPASDASLCIAADSEYVYSMPNLYSADVIEYIYTLAEFLTQRYDGDYGQLYGIIVGSKVDNTETVNSIGGLDVYGYAELYTLYLSVIENAARALNNKLDIVIPISDENTYNKAQNEKDKIQPSVLLEEIVKRLDMNVSGKVDCTLLVETNTAPITLNVQTEKPYFEALERDDIITPNSIGILLGYVNQISERYKSAPSNIIYLWNIDSSLSGNMLSAAYAYAYMRLAAIDNISTFAISTEADAYAELSSVIRHIDTESSQSVTAPLCKYFNMASWEEILASTVEIPVNKKLFEENISEGLQINSISEFQYMDFTSSNIYQLMYGGDNCEYIRTDYDKYGYRILKAGSKNIPRGDSVEVLGIFDYAESFIYTPIISIMIGIEDLQASSEALYEITVTLGTSETKLIARGALKNGESKQLYIDVEDFAEIANAEYIKISARCLTEDSKAMSLLLGDIKGYSEEYTEQNLSELVEAKRLQIRNQGLDDGASFDYTKLIVIIGIVVVGIVIAVCLTIPLKKEEDNRRK